MYTPQAVRLSRRRLALVLAAVLQAGCGDESTPQSPTTAERPDGNDVAHHSTKSPLSTVRWNRKAVVIFRSHLIPGTPAPPATRIHAYLDLAQYRATLAATKEQRKSRHDPQPSPAGAAAGASVVILKEFYPEDAGVIDAEVEAQRAQYNGRPDKGRAFRLGEKLGRETAVAVLAQAATDNFGVTPPPPVPTGPGKWVSSGAPIVTGGFGARPFFLRSASEINAEPPPVFESPEFLSGLAEVRRLSDKRTPEQEAIVAKWVPFSGVVWTSITADLIEKHHRNELQAARIFAYGSLAAFDAGIGCFGTKFSHWYIRPTQADPGITLATPLPNHPSYPSAHSCETGAWQAVLGDAFPSEQQFLNATAREASFSRVLGGLHYRFDGEAGLKLGRRAGRLALRRGLD